MRSSHSPTIRSRYDYYYSSMSPSSSAANFYDNQNQSLFGDPVPPSTDFLETLDNHLYGSLRRSSSLHHHNDNNTNNNINYIDNNHNQSQYIHQNSNVKSNSAINLNNISRLSVGGHRTGIGSAGGAGGYTADSSAYPSPLGTGVPIETRRNTKATDRLENYPLPHSVLTDPFRDGGYYYGLNRRRTSSSFSEEFRSNLESCR